MSASDDRLGPRPRRKLAVLACMDARIDLDALLGLERGDAHIVRNAGGLVTDDALRSLSASQRLLGTEEIVVVMHRDCGIEGPRGLRRLRGPRGATLRERPRAAAQPRPSSSPSDKIRGLIYDPADGSLEEIDG